MNTIAQQQHNPGSLLAEVRRLKAENATLRAGHGGGSASSAAPGAKARAHWSTEARKKMGIN